MASKQNRNMQSKRTSIKKSGKSVKHVEQKEKSFRDELILLLFVGISLLLFLGNFKLAGVGDSGGNWLSSRLFGFFGMMQYLLPVWLLLSAFLIFEYRNRTGIYKKIMLLFFIQLILGVIIELLHGKSNMGNTFWNYFENGKEQFFRGGAIGGWCANLLYGVFGILASLLILLLLMIGCVVLLTEKSFIKGVEKQSRRIYESTKEEMHQRRMQAEQSKSELQDPHIRQDTLEKGQDHRRKETVFRGMSKVTLDVPKKNKKPANRVDIHEIFLEESQDGVVEGNVSAQNPSITIQRGNGVREVPFEDAEDISIVKEKSPNLSKKGKEQLSKEEQGALEQEIEKNVGQVSHAFRNPSLELLKKGTQQVQESDAYLKKMGLKLQQTLQSFGVNVTVTNISCGPTVTRYELQPEQGVKVSRIVNLADDIKLNLAVSDIRIEAPIPGKAAVGIEVPNRENSTVLLRELLESAEFSNSVSPITFAVGKDISGKVIVADIARMPHLLIAGATGSGKSVCINTLIMSILYKADPNNVKLLMIDPKVVELSVYNGIPHLCHPVETDPKKAAGALNWAVGEMTRRYKLFADYNVRDLKGYNKKIDKLPDGEDRPLVMPHIVIIVDELADLMMVSKSEVEDSICRLAQLARAAGIHLIIATQRPSVDVITGLIKANMPSRIAFSVSSGVDSRTIIDMNGAEKLLGKGDMLFYPSGYPKPVRVQGAFVSDREVSDVVHFLKDNNQEAEYNQEIEQHASSVKGATSQDSALAGTMGHDELFVEAGKFIIEKDKGSIGMLQRVFRIGFNRAARIMDQLEEAGVVGGEEGTKARTVLMSEEQFENYIEESV